MYETPVSSNASRRLTAEFDDAHYGCLLVEGAGKSPTKLILANLTYPRASFAFLGVAARVACHTSYGRQIRTSLAAANLAIA